MKNVSLKKVLFTVLAVGMLSTSCFAAGSQTKVVETVTGSSSGKVDGKEVPVEIQTANTDMESANELQYVSVPEDEKKYINTIITETKKPDTTLSSLLETIRKEMKEQSKPDSALTVSYSKVEDGVLVTTTDPSDLNFSRFMPLTAPFELVAKDADGNVLNKLEDAKTTLKVLELQALQNAGSDYNKQLLIDSIHLVSYVNVDGNWEIRIIKPVSVDLETGYVTVQLGDLQTCIAQVYYDRGLVIINSSTGQIEQILGIEDNSLIMGIIFVAAGVLVVCAIAAVILHKKRA